MQDIDVLIYIEAHTEWRKLQSDYNGVLPEYGVIANRQIFKINETYRNTVMDKLQAKYEETRRRYEKKHGKKQAKTN